ncbi:MAG TPA: DUF4350 domain-containing protein, partial [Candidatus Baltobacteraceae bacterium]|nr:DUF4350 domain-containing protein [Candidatus Baltobacteraceae bacterium]
QNDLKALESWVRGGGRMLYLGHDDFAAGAGVLKLPHSARNRKHGQPFVAASLVARGVGRVESVSDLRWARAKSRSVLLADAAGPLVVRYPLGKGEVVAAIDEQAFTNGRIARADAARLAYALALPKRAGARVTFDETVHGFITPEHWWSVIPRPFAIAIWSALGVLLVALAGAALRLGPPVVPVRHAEASSAAFLDALAALFERGNAIRKVLRDAAASVTRAVAGALGMPDDLPTERLAAAMGEPAQRDAYLELMRIAEGGAPNRANLVRGIALAQRLRKELGSHGRSRN